MFLGYLLANIFLLAANYFISIRVASQIFYPQSPNFFAYILGFIEDLRESGVNNDISN
jgi:hypothetical protein